jgi:CubicO group peptidase (beta-lactamase class C family)
MEVHKGKIHCQPEEVGYQPEILDRMDNHFLDLINKGMIQAAGYLLARHGKVFALRSMGKQSSRSDEGDFLPDNIRPVASITKVFTVTAILQLMEQGKITIWQRASEFLKEFDNEMFRHINIFQLLTHTSGLKSDPGCFLEPYPEDWGQNMTRENWIKKFLQGPLQFKPGTVWNYCTAGFFFLGEIIARVSGMDYTTYVEKHILEPLGMTDSYFFIPDEIKKKVCLTSAEWPRRQLEFKKEDIFSPSFNAGGGLYSTLPDLWKFSQMMLDGGKFNGKRILGKTSCKAAVRPQIVDINAYNWQAHIFDGCYKKTYGIGWELRRHAFLGERVYDHEGAEGAGLYIDPDEDFIFAGFYPDTEFHLESWVSPLAIAWSGLD